MHQHCQHMGALDKDVVWDAPPILLGRKGYLRCAAYLAKTIAHMELEPSLVRVGSGRLRLRAARLLCLPGAPVGWQSVRAQHPWNAQPCRPADQPPARPLRPAPHRPLHACRCTPSARAAA
jgi:hypothetical protein